MKIDSVYLENIKRFGPDGFVFNFNSSNSIHTVSGVNGSGKTAAFKAIQLFQKIFFYSQLDENIEPNVSEGIQSAIDQLLSADFAVIDVAFKIDELKHCIKLDIWNEGGDFGYEFSDKTPNAFSQILKIWDIKNPKSLIVFLDAGKSFSDFGVSFDNISLKSRAKKDEEFTLDCIFSPDETLQAIYKRTVLDHVHYRLDPSRKYEYFRAANEATKIISPNIEVKNVSATKRDGQLVILGRTYSSASLFDVKDFSAGERALYLTLLFLFYLPNVGILIIDEPENHFHESLLSNFYVFLKELIESEGTYSWLQKRTKSKSAFTDEWRSSRLDQIFLVTHSKPLIYQNMHFGDCFIVSERELKRVYNSELERELRNLGISSVFSRTLFVEGKGDVEMLSSILALHRINVVPLSDCKEVIDNFRKISSIRPLIHGAAFCFAIDGDNKSELEINEIKRIDPDFFDESFIVLDRHEIENYLIDNKLIFDVINPILESMHEPIITSTELENIFNKESNSLKQHSMAKYLSSIMRSQAKALILDPISNTKNILNSVTDTIDAVFSEDISTKLKTTASDASSKFNDVWPGDWKSLVDGKAFMGKLLANLSNRSAGVKPNIIRRNIINRINDSPNQYECGKLIQKITTKINNQDFIDEPSKPLQKTPALQTN
jgi:hypothetical protein